MPNLQPELEPTDSPLWKSQYLVMFQLHSWHSPILQVEQRALKRFFLVMGESHPKYFIILSFKQIAFFHKINLLLTWFSNNSITSLTVSCTDLPTVSTTRSGFSGDSYAWSIPVKPLKWLDFLMICKIATCSLKSRCYLKIKTFIEKIVITDNL